MAARALGGARVGKIEYLKEYVNFYKSNQGSLPYLNSAKYGYSYTIVSCLTHMMAAGSDQLEQELCKDYKKYWQKHKYHTKTFGSNYYPTEAVLKGAIHVKNHKEIWKRFGSSFWWNLIGFYKIREASMLARAATRRGDITLTLQFLDCDRFCERISTLVGCAASAGHTTLTIELISRAQPDERENLLQSACSEAIMGEQYSLAVYLLKQCAEPKIEKYIPKLDEWDKKNEPHRVVALAKKINIFLFYLSKSQGLKRYIKADPNLKRHLSEHYRMWYNIPTAMATLIVQNHDAIQLLGMMKYTDTDLKGHPLLQFPIEIQSNLMADYPGLNFFLEIVTREDLIEAHHPLRKLPVEIQSHIVSYVIEKEITTKFYKKLCGLHTLRKEIKPSTFTKDMLFATHTNNPKLGKLKEIVIQKLDDYLNSRVCFHENRAKALKESLKNACSIEGFEYDLIMQQSLCRPPASDDKRPKDHFIFFHRSRPKDSQKEFSGQKHYRIRHHDKAHYQPPSWHLQKLPYGGDSYLGTIDSCLEDVKKVKRDMTNQEFIPQRIKK